MAHQAPLGIFQARIVEWVAIPFSRKSSLLGSTPAGSKGYLRMKGVGERRHVRPALIGPSLRGRETERERERVTRQGAQPSLAESGNALFFTVAFIP